MGESVNGMGEWETEIDSGAQPNTLRKRMRMRASRATK
jgi:hypothetical protein